ncbi:hypothetical protein AAHE18_06G081500 [Arachis hypogaea]
MMLSYARCRIVVSSSDSDANSQIFCEQKIKWSNLLLLGSNSSSSWLLLMCVLPLYQHICPLCSCNIYRECKYHHIVLVLMCISCNILLEIPIERGLASCN